MNLLRLAKAIGIVVGGGMALLSFCIAVALLAESGVYWPLFRLLGVRQGESRRG